MIPATTTVLTSTLAVTRQPSKNYKLHIEKDRISGYCDRQEAMKQVIYKILNTERYQWLIYSWNYGFEFVDLIGKSVNYVCAELERRITEALCQDDRINAVDSFEFDTSKKKIIHVTFTAHTIFGDVEAEKAVEI